jgi:hypothetical protein
VDAPLPNIANQAITISGAGARRTKIDGHGVADTIFSGTLVLKDLTVTGVRSDNAAVNAKGELDRVAIVGNHATGLFAPFTVVNDSLVAHNDGGQTGGIDGRGVLLLRNSTVTDNTAHATTGPAGTPIVFTGGVLATDGSSIENSTIVDNHVANDAPVITGLDLGSLSAVSLGLQLRSSIIGDGTDRACGGLIVSAGHNVASDVSCHLDQTGDKPGVALKLGPLANNGGPTDSISLLAGSPAIDAGTDCTAADQRGATRAQGSACDAGAFESPFTSAPAAVSAPGPIPPPAAATPDDTAPAVLTVGGVPRAVTRPALRRGLRVRIGASEPVVADVRLAAGAHKLARTSMWLGRTTRTFRLAPARPPAHIRRLHLRVVAIDASGNHSTRTLTVTLR